MAKAKTPIHSVRDLPPTKKTGAQPGKGTGKNPRGFVKEKAAFLEFLAGKTLKLTRQREDVVNEIFSGRGHFEAEEVVASLKEAQKRVSRATVYRTLELLRECQLVTKLDFGEAGALYEHTQLGEHHDHLICGQCGRAIEFHDQKLEKLLGAVCRDFQFQESHHSLRIFGLCNQCQKKKVIPEA